MVDLTRRQLLSAAAGTAAAATLGPGALQAVAGTGPVPQHYPALPDPAHSGLDHIVVVCMENRSFDHYLGWLPGAATAGRPAWSTATTTGGRTPRTTCSTAAAAGINDPDHSFEGGRVQFNDGRLDGFRKGDNDDFALGYYTEADLPFYGPLLKHAATFDRYFSSILAPTYPNRFYTHAAATDRISNTSTTSTLPTIWDRLADKGISRRYYFSDTPFLALWGQKYLADLQPGRRASSPTPPPVGCPRTPTSTRSSSARTRAAPTTTTRTPTSTAARRSCPQVAHAITTGPLWDRTALVITYDEWGGFFDHVAPPRLPDDHDTGPDGKDDHAQAGFRVPTMVLSPFARQGHVGHRTYDHTSILKMVEWRFGLAPLTKRDRGARNLAESFDFSHARPAPTLPVVADPGPHFCTPPTPGSGSAAKIAGGNPMGMVDPFWSELASSPLMRGWDAVGPVPVR